ncbi:peroxiredoxin [Blastococcus sp. KM273128]|uniref:peroxiredoxin n=1 Tax=Blastococcus sp. KM273128 TaxID=2570314 RepID=UPI001F1A293E|nr:peroxiredoxin [Blastococcus sp. KM273128]MCF6745909.1 peroxiredoxin [Blastococcus sp. KM273128]
MARSGLLEVGAPAPEFTLPDQTGRTVELSSLLAEGPVVVFFYPAAMSPGCTAQSCHFRDLAAEFAAAGARVVGVSRDSVDRQGRFDQAHELGYPLLADVTGEVCRAFGVARAPGHLLPLRRATFVVAPDRRILAVIHSELRMEAHADRALDVLRRRAAAAG